MQAPYKYNKTIMGGAEKLIDGLENIEMFLDDNDDWNFHDSEVRAFNWDAKERTLTVTVEPIGYAPDIEIDDGMVPLLDFHFTGVWNIHMEYNVPEYIYEVEISKHNNKYIECWFNGCCIRVISSGLTVDKPKIVPIEEVQQ